MGSQRVGHGWATKPNWTDILCSQRWSSSIPPAKTGPRPDCGSDNELLIAKFRLKLKKVGKATTPFRYDLNQIPYDYTVEVTKRLKGLDLIRVPKELWMEVCDIVQEAGIKTIPKKKKGKTVVWSSLTNSYEKKRSKRQRRKGYMVGIYWTGILGWVREENSMIENNLIKVSVIASSTLAWRIRWTEEPVGSCPWGRTESDTTEAT